MTASVEFLEILVTVATGITSLSPVVLLVLLYRDARAGRLW